jgi:hypothetical protein
LAAAGGELIAAGRLHLRNEELIDVMRHQGVLPPSVADAVAVALPTLELIAGGLLIFAGPSGAGSVVLIASLVGVLTGIAFAGYTSIVILNRRGDVCGCDDSQTPAGWPSLVRAWSLVIMSLTGLLLIRSDTGVALASIVGAGIGACAGTLLFKAPSAFARMPSPDQPGKE